MSLLDVLTDAASRAGATVAQRVRVVVKTNLGPGITVYDGAAGDAGPGLASALGLKGALTVYGPNDNVLYQTAPAPPTEPLKAALALLLAGVLLLLILRGLRR